MKKLRGITLVTLSIIGSFSMTGCSKQELEFDAWTDKTTYVEDDHMTVYCRVNRPAYVRLIYVLAAPDKEGLKYTLLHDSTHIQQTQVGSDVVIGRFVATPPFGSEQLIVLAQEQPFSPINTIKRDGYYYLTDSEATKIRETPITHKSLAILTKP